MWSWHLQMIRSFFFGRVLDVRLQRRELLEHVVRTLRCSDDFTFVWP